MPTLRGTLRKPGSIVGHILQPVLEARGTIQLFRIAAIVLVFWYERLTFLYASLACSSAVEHQQEFGTRQPSGGSIVSSLASSSSLSLTILSDPQLIDSKTYPWADSLISPLSSAVQYILRWASDTYAQKSFAAVVRLRGRGQSQGVIWLGDLLDGGRRPFLSTDDVLAFEKLAKRFKGLFEEKLPSIYIPGNHDIRIPITHDPTYQQEWKDSRARWLEEWGIWQDAERGRATWSRRGGKERVVLYPPGGPAEVDVEATQWKHIINARFPLYLNESSPVPTHEIVMLDSLELAGMQPAAVASNPTFNWQEEAKRRFRETYDFVQSFSSRSSSEQEQTQRILISHIPLSRPANSNCNMRDAHHGVLRESGGAIDQGVDQYATYQNLLSASVTQWVLDAIRPEVVFSGDNHDHCEVRHQYAGGTMSTTELTLKAFSMTEGVRIPGYARLALHYDQVSGQASTSYAPCLLPDQISIWTQSYPLALALVFAALLADRKWRLGARLDQQARLWMVRWQDWLGLHGDLDEEDEEQDWHLVEENSGLHEGHDDEEEEDEDAGKGRHPARGQTLSPGKRIRFGRTSLALQPMTERSTPSSSTILPRISPSLSSPTRPGASTLSTSPSSFQARAWRELRRAAKANEKVILRDGPLREMAKILVWPLALWIWLQLF